MGVEIKRWGNEIPFSVPTNTYQCRDGLVMAGVLLDTHWKVLARMAGREELAEHADFATIPGRMSNRKECDAMFAKWCEARTVEEAVAECAREGIPCAKVRTYAEAARDPHTIERDMLQQVAQEDGKLAPITGPAAKFSRTPTRIRTGAPALGAHTEEILAELGIDADASKRLRESGVV
jgi:formyl-CoA transferase